MKIKRPLIFAIIVISFLGIFYYGLVNTDRKEDFFKTQKRLPVPSNILQIKFNLPFQDEYLLEIERLIQKGQAKTAFLNGNLLELKFSKKGRDVLTEYYLVSAETVHKGSNSLKINFYSAPPPEVKIRIGNYISREAEGNVFFLSKESRLVRNRPKPILSSALFMAVLFLIWQGSFYFWRRSFSLSEGEAILRNIISFSPSFLILGLAWAVSNYSPEPLPVSLLISSSYLYRLVVFSVILVQIIIGVSGVGWRKLAYYGERGRALEEEEKPSPLLSGRVRAVILEKRRPEWMTKAIGWIKQRKFSDKCILLFMILLVLAAFLLVLRLTRIAEQLANIAYFSLVVGVGMKFVDLVRRK